MPLDIQWFIYALISNGAITQADADRFYQSLGANPDLEAYAQLVLDQLVSGLSEEDQQSVLEQIQSVIDYAVAQAETGIAPNLPQNKPARPGFPPAQRAGAFPPAQRAAAFPPAQRAGAFPPARRGYIPPSPGSRDMGEPPEERRGGDGGRARTAIVQDSATRFDSVDIDLSQIQSYADLPSLRNVSEMSDPELQQLVITLLTCLRALGASKGAIRRTHWLLAMQESLWAVLLANTAYALILLGCAFFETGFHTLSPAALVTTLTQGLLWQYPWSLYLCLCLAALVLITLLRVLPYHRLCQSSVIGTIKGLERGE